MSSSACYKGLLWGGAIGVDSTTIQANASMRSIVRKDSGKGWKDYTRKIAKKAGLDDPTDDEAAPDDGLGEESLDDHAGTHRNRRSKEPPGPPRASANYPDSLLSADTLTAIIPQRLLQKLL